MSHLGTLVPHALLNKLSHCAHVKALKGGKVNAKLCVSVLGKETAYFCELISNTNVKRLFVWLVAQNNTTWSYCNFFVVHCPAYLSNVILVC